MIVDGAYALAILPDLLEGACVTLAATLCGMAAALVVGLAFALLRQAPSPRAAQAGGVLVRFIRGTPLLVQLYLLFYVLPLTGARASPFVTGVVGLGLHYGAYMSEVYRAGLAGVPRGQHEAALALGLRTPQRWALVVLPQAVIPMLPVIGNLAIGMFKDTPVLATVTIVELFGAAQQAAGESYRYTEPITLVGLIFLALSLPAAAAVAWFGRRIAEKRA